jgi:AhpD family alkylhydroperoxidase
MKPPVRHVAPVAPDAATGTVAAVFRQVKSELGVIGPAITMTSPAPEVLAAVWALLRESLLVGGPEERVAKEVVATAVAVKNECRFCMDAHTMMLHAAGEPELAEAVGRAGRRRSGRRWPRGRPSRARWGRCPPRRRRG